MALSLRNAPRKIWQTLSSIKTGVILIILVVIFSAAGTVILQRPMTDPDDMQRAYSPAMLRFLERRRLFRFERAALSRIGSAQRLVGPLQSWLIQAMLDRHVAGGRYWNFAFPPPVPGRYSAHRQWRKRFANTATRAPVS